VPDSGAACSRPTSRRSDQNFIKRLVAGPGDRIAIIDDRVILNGERQSEPFIQAQCEGGLERDFPAEITSHAATSS
jgi:signal peptidase I